MSPKKVTLLVVGGFLALFVVITVFKSVVTVEKGHVGVVMHWGAVQEKPLDPGLHFVMPFKTSVE